MKTECEEIAEILFQAGTDRPITMDEARKIILWRNPEWKNGGETPQVIDNTAQAYMKLNNRAVCKKGGF